MKGCWDIELRMTESNAISNKCLARRTLMLTFRELTLGLLILRGGWWGRLAKFRLSGMAFALCASVGTSSCAVLNFPHRPELDLVKVEAILPPFTQYNSPLLTWYGESGQPLLMVTVKATRNLLRLGATHSLHIGVDVSGCPFKPRPGLRHDPTIYVQDIEANRFVLDARKTKETDIKIDAYNPPAEDATYKIFILPKYDSRLYPVRGDAQGPIVIVYDLFTSPMDICMQIVGYSMLAYGFESNILTVSKEQIIKVLQQSQSTHS